MKTAKALVWIMSSLILALLVLLVVGISRGWHLDDPVDDAAASLAVGGSTVTLGQVQLGQPVGTEVTGVAEVGGSLAVSLSGGGLGARVILVDVRTGEIVGEISISGETD